MQSPVHNQELKPKANPKTDKQKTVVCSTTVCFDFDFPIHICQKLYTIFQLYYSKSII